MGYCFCSLSGGVVLVAIFGCAFISLRKIELAALLWFYLFGCLCSVSIPRSAVDLSVVVTFSGYSHFFKSNVFKNHTGPDSTLYFL